MGALWQVFLLSHQWFINLAIVASHSYTTSLHSSKTTLLPKNKRKETKVSLNLSAILITFAILSQ